MSLLCITPYLSPGRVAAQQRTTPLPKAHLEQLETSPQKDKSGSQSLRPSVTLMAVPATFQHCSGDRA